MTPNPLLHTSWRVIKGIEYLPEVAVTAEFSENFISGFSGCNNYRAPYESDGTRLQLHTPVAATRKMCPEAEMATETAFLECLAKVATFHLDGDRLELAGENGKLLLAFRRIVVNDFFGTWRVINVHMPERKAIVSIDDKLQLTFEEGFLHIDSGRNTFCWQWSAEGTDFRISPMNTTPNKHKENALIPLERSLLLALRSVARWSIAGRQLLLLRGDGGIAVSLFRSDDEC